MILTQRLHTLFRVACAMCFIGHGAFGIITKQAWCNYFAIFGIGESLAYQLMPVVGVVDIILGILFIVYPIRAIAGWLIFWGLFTAVLRPLSGEPVAEMLERAGNYGAPLILLLLSGPVTMRPGYWFAKMEPHPMNDEQMKTLTLWLRVIACTLLLGHGWLNLIEKGGLVKQYVSIGIGNPVLAAHLIGAIEIAGALMMLVKPIRHIVLFLFVWKMVSEVLYPAYPFFEWVERAGSYAVIFGLWYVLQARSVTSLISMKKSVAISILPLFLILPGCGNDKLSNDEVKRLLEENKVYPQPVQAQLFINEEATAGKIRETDLEEEGYLVAQLTHTKEDLGQSLVRFTDKAAPYLIAKTDSIESIEIQLVKVADEFFSEVTAISYSENGMRATVDYTVEIKDKTPFAVLLKYEIPAKQSRQTSFTRENDNWIWGGEISR